MTKEKSLPSDKGFSAIPDREIGRRACVKRALEIMRCHEGTSQRDLAEKTGKKRSTVNGYFLNGYTDDSGLRKGILKHYKMKSEEALIEAAKSLPTPRRTPQGRVMSGAGLSFEARKEIALRLRNLIGEKDLKQAAVAEAAEISVYTIGIILNPEVSPANKYGRDKLERVLEILEVKDAEQWIDDAVAAGEAKMPPGGGIPGRGGSESARRL